MRRVVLLFLLVQARETPSLGGLGELDCEIAKTTGDAGDDDALIGDVSGVEAVVELSSDGAQGGEVDGDGGGDAAKGLGGHGVRPKSGERVTRSLVLSVVSTLPQVEQVRVHRGVTFSGVQT